MTNFDTARQGMVAVSRILVSADWAVKEAKDGRRSILIAQRGHRQIRLLVKSKRRGDWQTSTMDGEDGSRVTNAFWVLVDLAGAPDFYIMPEAWLRQNIRDVHEQYLKAHGWRDDVERGSDHHSINLQRVKSWQGRWDILDGS